MASVINTNMASISAQRFLGTAQTKLATSFERLSSGMRINRAQDDAAGMGISQALTSSVNSTSMAMRNANDAIGVIQTAEGALTEISTMLQRFKELATRVLTVLCLLPSSSFCRLKWAVCVMKSPRFLLVPTSTA
jgi:flagellin